MKTPVFMRLCALLLAAFMLSTQAYGHAGHCEDTDLGATMADMKKMNKRLKKAVRKDDFEAVTKYAAALKKAGTESAEYEPLMYKGQAEKFASLEDDYHAYYQKMDQILTQMLAAASAQDSEQVEALFDQLNGNRKKAHKAFQKECH